MNERLQSTEPIDPRLERLGALMRTSSETDAPMQRHLEGRARLIAAVEEMRPSRRGRWVAASSILAAAAVIALVVGWRLHVTRSISYELDGAVATQGYVSLPPGAATATMRFSDGSEVALSGGSRSRVASTTPDGAEIVLESGRANVHVVHREKTSWVVDAGPFAVHVTGTAFTVAWSVETDSLDVWMKDGRVVVVGPGGEQGIAVSGGQHLHAASRDRTLLIDGNVDANVAPPPAPSSSANDVVDPAPPSSSSAPLAPVTADDPTPSTAPKSSAKPTTGWGALVARGAYADVVREANDQGIGAALGARSLGDLRALGDAARFTGDTGLAVNAYGAIRRRFPSSGEARTAAFLLGRIAEEQQRSPAAALRWYDTYLSEAPNGPFAGDVLGRKMILVSRSSGAAAAKPIAQDYLTRFPRGTYASAARNLTQ